MPGRVFSSRRGWLLLLAFVFCVSIRAEDPDKLPPPSGSYVSDFAGVIDAGSKAEIDALSREVYEKAHATIVIVTVKSLDGDTIENFTTKLEDKWKVGPKNSDRGVVMVFAINDHKRRIEVGYGLEGILNDAKVGDIGRTMVPQLQQGDYGTAILGGERQIAQVIADDSHVTLDTTVNLPAQHTYHYETTHHRSSGGGWIGIIIFIAIILLISRGGRGGGGGGGWMWFLLGNLLGGGGRGGFGGGGFGGGDSGGGSSGGGGDFGGGFGGGSGGGGASGDW